jgi:hypothetical protein
VASEVVNVSGIASVERYVNVGTFANNIRIRYSSGAIKVRRLHLDSNVGAEKYVKGT